MPTRKKTRSNTPSLSTLKAVLGFPTDANAKRQYASVDYAGKNPASIGSSVFPLSVMRAIKKTSGMKETIALLVFSMNLKSATSVCGACAKYLSDTVMTRTLSYIVSLSPCKVLRRDSALATCGFI